VARLGVVFWGLEGGPRFSFISKRGGRESLEFDVSRSERDFLHTRDANGAILFAVAAYS